MVFSLISYYEMEKNMKKFIIALMAFAFVITLAGCGGGGGGSSYHLDYGDNGAALIKYEDNDLTGIKKSYDGINAVLSDAKKTTDEQVKSIMDCISDKYQGKPEYQEHKNGDKKTDMRTKDNVKSRLDNLIKDKKSTGLLVIPYKTKDVHSETIIETTTLHVDSLEVDGSKFTNRDYQLELEWKNEGTAENPVWKIINGFTPLGKNRSDF